MHIRTIAAWAVQGLITVSAANAQAFRVLLCPPDKPNGVVSALSGTGAIKVGYIWDAPTQYEAVYWDEHDELVRLGFLPGTTSSYALDVSSDGRVIVGSSGASAFVWTAETGIVALPTLGPSQRGDWGRNCSADGRVIGGMSISSPVLWRDAGPPELVLSSSPGGETLIDGVSDDGSVIAGFHASPFHSPWSFFSSPATGLVNLGEDVVIEEVSGDGRYAVGTGTQWLRWSVERGFERVYTSDSCYARAVNYDGSVVVGECHNFLQWTTRAAVWTERTGLVNLTDYAAAQGVSISPWIPRESRTVNSRGDVIGGSADYPSQLSETKPFVVRIRVSCGCPADFNCDAFVDFFDYAGFVEAFEGGEAAADWNNDGFLDFFDYIAFVEDWERGCP